MATITVFTPAYNRSKLLKRCYDSLKRQELDSFVWLIVDDGSTDDTCQVVESWMAEPNPFEIRYVYKENGGLHTAYNTAIEHADTDLCVCIDSDDYMPDGALRRIVDFWDKHGSDRYAGIIGLDFDMDGECLGDPLPNMDSLDLIKLTTGQYPLKNADRKLVIRTELYKSVAPMPSYPGEKNFNPQYMHVQIGLKYEFLVMNECLCVVDYQPEGMSNSMMRQYFNSPNSFADIRLLDMSLPGTSTMFKFKKCIHYCSSCFLAHRKHMVKNSRCKGLTVLAVVPGWLLSRMIVRKNRGK